MATVTQFPTLIPPLGIPTTAWHDALEAAYATAQKAMPDAGERLERAMCLVRTGAVEHAGEFGEHHYTVFSESDPAGLTTYHVHAQAPQSCTCDDWTHQSGTRKGAACKHLLAVWLYRRALAQVPAPTPAEAAPQQPSSAVATAPGWGSRTGIAGLPEAAFSLCLQGRLAGQQAQLTVRGGTYAEFAANVAAVRGLLDEPSAPKAAPPTQPPASQVAQPTPEGWCVVHGIQMERQSNERGSWYSHKTAEGWCRGKLKKG